MEELKRDKIRFNETIDGVHLLERDDPAVKTLVEAPLHLPWLKKVQGAMEDPDLRELIEKKSYTRVGPAFYDEKDRGPLTFADVGPDWQKDNPVEQFAQTNVPTDEAMARIIEYWGANYARVYFQKYAGPLLSPWEHERKRDIFKQVLRGYSESLNGSGE